MKHTTTMPHRLLHKKEKNTKWKNIENPCNVPIDRKIPTWYRRLPVPLAVCRPEHLESLGSRKMKQS